MLPDGANRLDMEKIAEREYGPQPDLPGASGSCTVESTVTWDGPSQLSAVVGSYTINRRESYESPDGPGLYNDYCWYPSV
jgi:hypothetical protein